MEPLTKNGQPILSFTSAGDFNAWLLQHHADTPGMWLRIYKKASGVPTVDWAGAVEQALCYGWIDSVKNTYDADSYLQRFTPRSARSIWSKKNVQTIERLIADGRLHAAGLLQVEQAKADGRWAAAYDSPKDMQMPQDFLDELERHPKAKAFFATLNKTNRYAIAFRLHNAKQPETRTRRLEQFIAMLDEGQALY